ncbi:MAG: hypothetical protein FJ026_02035 [Chloroflexi bacterium]|nr:hypothetical protein [Chloroflexota bacterium]
MQTWLLACCDLKTVVVAGNWFVRERRLSGLSPAWMTVAFCFVEMLAHFYTLRHSFATPA